MDLQIGDDHARKSQDRSDRQVDMPADDDEDHAGRHDAHDAGLHRQIVHIPGREKDAVGHDIEVTQMTNRAMIMANMRLSMSACLRHLERRFPFTAAGDA